MEKKTWTVVKFIDENTVEAVPTSWIIGQECYWPSYITEKIRIAIRNYEQPNTCWQRHRISVFRNATFETYQEAIIKSTRAEYNSDLTDIDESRENRKLRRKKNVTSSSSSEETVEKYFDYQLPIRNKTGTVAKADQNKHNRPKSQSLMVADEGDSSEDNLNLAQLPIRNKSLTAEKADQNKQNIPKSQALKVPDEYDTSEDILNSAQQPGKNKTGTVKKANRYEPNRQASQSSMVNENSENIFEHVPAMEPCKNSKNNKETRDCRCCPVHHIIDFQKIIDNIATVMENSKLLLKKNNLIVSMVSENLDQFKKLSDKVENLKLQNPISDGAAIYDSFLDKFEFPLSSNDQFVEFDEYLKEDNNYKAAVGELSKIGGSDQYDYVRRVLGLLMKNCLAMKFTWMGTKDKSAFCKTKVAEVLLKSLQSTPHFTDQKNSEAAIKKYLRRARERDAYEKK